MTLDIKDRLYTSSEVAEILGVSLRSVYRYLEEGKLDADIKTATGRHRFSKKNILDFLQPSESQNKVSAPKVVEAAPATEKVTFSPTETISEDFDFDNFFETDIVKKDDNLVANETVKSPSPSITSDEDDLEKLFEELEKEFSSQTNLNTDSEKKVSKLAEDDFEFDFDFLEGKESVTDYLNIGNESKEDTKTKKDDSDFDFDFLEDFFDEEKKDKTDKPNLTNYEQPKKVEAEAKKDESDFDFLDLDSFFENMSDKKEDIEVKEEKKSVSHSEDSSESWLERFRKASEKTNESKPTPQKENDDFDISSFFNNKTSVSSLSNKDEDLKFNEKDFKDEFKSSREAKKTEYYYISSLSGPKEIAQTIDKVSRKFDLDYAFTLNAGLSLHKDISPFTLIHVYVNERDLEIFEDYLKLTPSSERDAHLCIKLAHDREVFADSYELNGLFVVSNVQLRSDFIDKGMDNYAREV